jgi:hypothetical protein
MFDIYKELKGWWMPRSAEPFGLRLLVCWLFDARPEGPRQPSLHRSQILRDLWAMQAVAAELSGYARKFRCFLERRV